jgi:ABC-type glycerol-3-phosphate transport system substrate-binding protein
MNNFQTIMIAVFLAFFIFAVLIFSGILKIGGVSNSTNTPQGNVVIWGTLNSPDINKIIDNLNQSNKNLFVSYIVKPEATYEQSLIEAFANGTGPDLFIMKSDMIGRFEKFVYKIPYASYPERSFRDSFIDGASVYLAPDGITGLPLVVDPIVMYYNKNIFSNAGIAQVPQYWNELFNLSSQLTQKKDDGTILQSMIALGRYDNVAHAKDILATLFMQSGNSIIKSTTDGTTTKYVPVLDDNPALLTVPPVETVLNFFVEFATPSDSAYSWNRSLPNSLDMFTGGKMAMYIGRASELFKIQSINPNLSFDITQVLQTKGASTKRTYGDIYAISANKKSTNLTASVGVSQLLTTGDNADSFSKAVSLPPVLRTLIAIKPTDLYLSTFFDSAVISQSWIDPNSAQSDDIFNELIQNILSNNLSVGDAINKSQGEFEQILNK